MNKLIGLSLLASIGLATGCQVNERPGHSPIATTNVGTPAKGKFLTNVDANGVALQGGYDPVAFFTDHKPVKGDPRFQSAYRGAIYYFATSEHKSLFDANPAKYEPQFGGFCAYAASINHVSQIDVEYWEIVDGRLLLQHNKKAWDLWHKDAAGNLVSADKNWPGLVESNGL